MVLAILAHVSGAKNPRKVADVWSIWCFGFFYLQYMNYCADIMSVRSILFCVELIIFETNIPPCEEPSERPSFFRADLL